MAIEALSEHDPVRLKEALKNKIIEITKPESLDVISYTTDWSDINLGKFNLLFDKKMNEDQAFLTKCNLNIDDIAKQFQRMLVVSGV